MAKPARAKWIFVGIICILGAAVIGTSYRLRHDLRRNLERASLPEAIEYAEVTAPTLMLTSAAQPAAIVPSRSAAPAQLPAAVNLAIPFTPQAPHANWEDPYGELCEEASVLMAIRYIHQQKIASPDDADAAMLAIKAFEDDRFGYYQDTTAAETAAIITEYFDYHKVQIVENPAAADIRSAVAAGKPVIIPAAGRALNNPYFQTPGPLYHMLVVKGYTKTGQFITNDPGTRRGADFLYDESTLMNAMHDWRTDHNIEQGKKVMLVVG
ncbi:MAG: hypothetical protein COT71_02885 [Candidatus Andersenbacteria bacterium CG10_big_fil_rev_8_21_14_0_10_54_11]|uniref:Peptidase C39-like domain-containing protein n=1 Tax=Candidatus Andersenbacteria bacterium CG10_big_fil_rev_8_21_14_0_10_54_11 TaxID=1974485 RepID=A0A2M6WZ02_9BACT|nr:MAG: hypothetical protein COT71_02885 [Candidatus Andersenbacteria bacterium CG10_big_fil_rev_8_21_14_0_10_54_11]